MLKKASWVICLLILAISCLDEPDCFRLNNNLVGISFRKMLDGQADTVALIGVQASGTDSIFNKFILTSGIYLPLNYFDDQTAFALQDFDELNQLLFGYEVRTQFISEDCGARYVLGGLSLLGHTFDSVRIVSDEPATAEGGVNLEIYRCPRTNLLEFSFRQLQGEGSVATAPKIVSITDGFSTRYIDTTLQTVYLPLNPAATSSQFDFTFPDGSNFFNVDYFRRSKKFFELCGDQQLFSHLIVTNHDFDSLTVFNDSIKDPPVTNIAVYRCPQMNQVRVYFRKNGAPVRADSLVNVSKVTDDYSGQILYENVKYLTFATLSLNEAAAETEFTFEQEGGLIRKLKFGYTRTPTVLFNACGTQTVFSELNVISDDFTSTIIKVPTVQFPVVTNVEIVQ